MLTDIFSALELVDNKLSPTYGVLFIAAILAYYFHVGNRKLRESISADSKAFRSETAAEFKEIAAEFKALRSESAAEFKALRSESAAEFKALRSELATQSKEMGEKTAAEFKALDEKWSNEFKENNKFVTEQLTNLAVGVGRLQTDNEHVISRLNSIEAAGRMQGDALPAAVGQR